VTGGTQAVVPGKGAKRFVPHATQVALDGAPVAVETVPAGQGVQDATPAPPTTLRKVPAGQLTHTLAAAAPGAAHDE